MGRQQGFLPTSHGPAAKGMLFAQNCLQLTLLEKKVLNKPFGSIIFPWWIWEVWGTWVAKQKEKSSPSCSDPAFSALSLQLAMNQGFPFTPRNMQSLCLSLCESQSLTSSIRRRGRGGPCWSHTMTLSLLCRCHGSTFSLGQS